MPTQERPPKPLHWAGPTRKQVRNFPKLVRDTLGFALYRAQIGKKHVQAKPLKGFGSAGVLEIVEDYDTDTCRAVYTVKFTKAVYVLHTFKKKSKTGRRTSQSDIDLVRRRLREAAQDYAQQYEEHAKP